MKVLALCFFLLLAPGGASAAGNAAVVEVRTFLSANAVHPGQAVRLALVATVAPGYHINDHKPSLDYLIPTEIDIAKSPSWHQEKVVYPRGNPRKFAFLDSPIAVYEGKTRIGVVLRAARSLHPGNYKLRGDFSYQACNDHACLPPAKIPFAIAVHLVPSSVPVRPENSEVFREINFR